MDYREFVDRISKDLAGMLPEELQGVRISPREVEKLQGASYYGISVQPENARIGLTMNLADAYEGMKDGASYEEALRAIAESVEKGLEQKPEINADSLTQYSEIKGKLMVQVVSTEANREMLQSIPHRDREDMSMVYRIVLDRNKTDMASVLVTNEMLNVYGINADQLHEDAMTNAQEKFPAKVRGMQEVLAEMMGMDPEMLPDDPQGMYVATCNEGMNGAGCIFYPDFMKQAAQKLEGDFFILPSSVHEVILLPDNGEMNFRELESMVQEINASEVGPADQLSDSVYHYDSLEHVFEKAETFETRQMAKEAEKEQMQEKYAKKEYSDLAYSGKDTAKGRGTEKESGHEKKSVREKLDVKKKEAAALDGGKKVPHKTKTAEL